ncbi:thermopsin [Vulcanisaeta sp. JCM 16161]|uniref:thermopsin n=1 Tax=Vulcanisaeta sp. JCM 16161 TaxID=1295372 RepID=UPI00406C3A10
MFNPLILLAILVAMPNSTAYQQVNPLINNYGVYTYPINYAVIYNHVIGSGTYIMTIAPGTYYSVSIYGPGPLGLYLASNTNVLTLVLSSQGLSELKTGATVKPLFAYYGQALNATIELPGGEYYIVVINNGSLIAQVMLVTTHGYPTPIVNAPIGVVDYGLMPSQVGYIPYSYTTSEFLGEARILSASFQPLTNCSSLPPGSFSLQLNAVLEMTINNQTQYYWVQNVLIINPTYDLMAPLVNVWNMSSTNLTMNPLLIIGHGSVVNNEVYAFMGNWTPYEMPLAVNLTITTNRTVNGYPQVLIGYSMGGINALVDNVTFLMTPSWGPYLVVNGSEYSPLGYLIDAEFVIGGPGCGAMVRANELNAVLSLYYRGPGGGLLPVPSAWSMGSDTGETVVNARAYAISPGTVGVTIGSEYVGPLTNADYLAFLILNDYLLNNQSITSIELPLPVNSRVFVTTPRDVYLGNNTLLRLAGLLINNEYVNFTELMLVMNQSYVVNYLWTKYYRLSIVDASNQLTNMSGWYNGDSIVNITVPKTIVYLGNETRLVFAGFTTNATHYTIVSNTLVLLMDMPVTVTINWIREYNTSLTLYTINGAYVGTTYLGWVRYGEGVTNVSINGITYELRTPLIISGVNGTAVLNAEYREFNVRDALGLPEPFTQVVIKCGGQELIGVTNAYGVTQELLIPIGTGCMIEAPVIGYYGIALVTAIILIAALAVMRLIRRR